jgi:hypothetical protein
MVLIIMSITPLSNHYITRQIVERWLVLALPPPPPSRRPPLARCHSAPTSTLNPHVAQFTSVGASSSCTVEIPPSWVLSDTSSSSESDQDRSPSPRHAGKGKASWVARLSSSPRLQRETAPSSFMAAARRAPPPKLWSDPQACNLSDAASL